MVNLLIKSEIQNTSNIQLMKMGTGMLNTNIIHYLDLRELLVITVLFHLLRYHMYLIDG